MDPWWSETVGTYIGAFGGAGVGVVCGTYGALGGLLATRGQARRLVMGVHVALLATGLLALVAGIVALLSGQPYHVWYPLVLIGGITSVVMGAMLPTLRRRYAVAENRKLDAEQLRRELTT